MISVDWPNYLITVPRAYLTDVGGGKYQLDLNQFRNDLTALLASEDGMPWPDTHIHTPQTVLSGIVYARQVLVLSPYTITFEDLGSPWYTVEGVGANHNVGDVKNVNPISLIIGNSAGLIVVTTGSGLSAPQNDALMGIRPDLEVINRGVQDSSLLIPHIEELP